MKKTTFLSFLLIISIAGISHAQDRLSLQDAIGIALENNFNIQIFENRLEIASNNRSLGNSGILPSLDLTATRAESVEDSEFETGTGGRETNTGARSTNTNASLNFNWTIFDGLRMFRTYDLLGELEKISDKELRLEMERLIAEITSSYFDIVRIENQLRVVENTVEVSLERIEIEETKLDLGSGSEVELLQARSDLNADRALFLRERNILNEAKISLNELLSRDPMTGFSVSEEIPVRRDLNEEMLFERLMSDNSELEIARMQQNAADLEMKQIQGERFPEVSVVSGYSFNRIEGGGGFLRFNETTGFRVGITARINIFDGFNTNRRVQNAQINRKNSALQLRESRLRLEAQFRTVYRAYENSLQLVDLEQDNLSNAEETLDIALERFRLGDISSLEFREAQRTFLTAENRLINARFEAKIAEIELLKLSGVIAESEF